MRAGISSKAAAQEGRSNSMQQSCASFSFTRRLGVIAALGDDAFRHQSAHMHGPTLLPCSCRKQMSIVRRDPARARKPPYYLAAIRRSAGRSRMSPPGVAAHVALRSRLYSSGISNSHCKRRAMC